MQIASLPFLSKNELLEIFPNEFSCDIIYLIFEFIYRSNRGGVMWYIL